LLCSLKLLQSLPSSTLAFLSREWPMFRDLCAFPVAQQEDNQMSKGLVMLRTQSRQRASIDSAARVNRVGATVFHASRTVQPSTFHFYARLKVVRKDITSTVTR
jgi:hypothetical protein